MCRDNRIHNSTLFKLASTCCLPMWSDGNWESFLMKAVEITWLSVKHYIILRVCLHDGCGLEHPVLTYRQTGMFCNTEYPEISVSQQLNPVLSNNQDCFYNIPETSSSFCDELDIFWSPTSKMSYANIRNDTLNLVDGVFLSDFSLFWVSVCCTA